MFHFCFSDGGPFGEKTEMLMLSREWRGSRLGWWLVVVRAIGAFRLRAVLTEVGGLSGVA